MDRPAVELGVFSYALNPFHQHSDRVLEEDGDALKTAWFTLYLCNPPCFLLMKKWCITSSMLQMYHPRHQILMLHHGYCNEGPLHVTSGGDEKVTIYDPKNASSLVSTSHRVPYIISGIFPTLTARKTGGGCLYK